MSRRFLSGYYLGNAALLGSVELFGISREAQVAYCMTVVLLAKFSSSPTWDAYVGTLFMWGKVCLLFLSFLVGWRFALYYLIAVLVLKVVWPQPEYDGPQNITYLDKDTFYRFVKDEAAYALVEFYTTWSPPCVQLAPLFANLSLKYGSSSLRFGKIDVGKYPELAEDFRISTKGTSRQLPTLILFHLGKEKARLPPISQSSVLKCSFREKDIVSALDLQYASLAAPKRSNSRKKAAM